MQRGAFIVMMYHLSKADSDLVLKIQTNQEKLQKELKKAVLQ
jgi:hypothetical protein